MAPKAKLTSAEAQALVNQWGNPTVAAKNTEFSRGAILHALARGPEPDEPTPAELQEANENLKNERDSLRSVNRTLQRKLSEAKARSEDLVAATYDGARDAVLSLGPVKPVLWVPRPAGKGRPEVGLWCFTDWQGSKKTTTYNSQIMEERVMAVARSMASITDMQRHDHPVEKCVIALGGDMVEGLFNFPTQAFEVDATIFEQFVIVSRLLEQVVRFALSVFKEVEVVAEWGNHGRIGSKRDNVPRYDNIDRMVYEMTRQNLRDEKRLKWDDCPEDIQRIEVGNYRALLIHGDEVGRNGYASPMQIVNHANRWRSGAYRWDFRDVYLGHYHTHAEWPMANGLGAVYQTGSTESDNRYALVGMAASATPTQRLHFIDPEKGRVTSQWKIYAEDA